MIKRIKRWLGFKDEVKALEKRIRATEERLRMEEEYKEVEGTLDTEETVTGLIKNNEYYMYFKDGGNC